MKRLYYLGNPGDGYGWGVANTNIIRELTKLGCEVVCEAPESARDVYDDPVFAPIATEKLTPLKKFKAPRIVGYAFTEWPLP